jgi:hypothetical protein
MGPSLKALSELAYQIERKWQKYDKFTDDKS